MRKYGWISYTLLIEIMALSVLHFSFAAATEIQPSPLLFDTGRASTDPWSGEDIVKKDGWTQVPEDNTSRVFTGDAVLINDNLALIIRQNGNSAELYARMENTYKLHASLLPNAAAQVEHVSACKILENNTGNNGLEVTYSTEKKTNVSIRFELGMGQTFVKTKGKEGITTLKVSANGRFAVLPDFFADDMVIDAQKIPSATADLPSENFLLQMLNTGDAILTVVCSNRDQDIGITLSGQNQERVISGSQIQYGKDGEIWVGLIQAPGVWHCRDIRKEDAGNVIALDWKEPFPAQWRVDWQCANQITDSWEMLVEQNEGNYIKYGWLGNPESNGTEDWLKDKRARWTTVLGWFLYPCWIDKNGQGRFQPLAENAVQFAGPTLIYPINRIQETPLNRFTVVDIVRATLGVGPCEYILDLEGQKQSYKGMATCGARDTLNPIYQKNMQKKQRKVVEASLTKVLAFVKHIRGRINEYIAFGHELLAYLEEQKKTQPKAAEFIQKMETLTQRIDEQVAKRRKEINTPEYAEKLVNEFRTTLVDYEGPDAFQKCKKLTGALVEVGGNQDELVGESRMVVKILRQRAGLAIAVNPDTAEIAKEIRDRTQKVLRNPASYEAPRH